MAVFRGGARNFVTTRAIGHGTERRTFRINGKSSCGGPLALFPAEKTSAVSIAPEVRWIARRLKDSPIMARMPPGDLAPRFLSVPLAVLSPGRGLAGSASDGKQRNTNGRNGQNVSGLLTRSDATTLPAGIPFVRRQTYPSSLGCRMPVASPKMAADGSKSMAVFGGPSAIGSHWSGRWKALDIRAGQTRELPRRLSVAPKC